MNTTNLDSLIPAEMAIKAEEVGIKKAGLGFGPMFALAILAGAFIALGAIFATTVSSGSIAIYGESGSRAFSTGLPYGIVRLLSGLAFTLGLILVIVGGAELFTGNNLIVIAFSSGKVTLISLLRNWVIVYSGNFVGSVVTALIMFVSEQYKFANGAVGLTALTIGESKTSLGFLQAIALGIMCNAMVCMAVWMCYSARTTTDKILSIIPPIAGFVASGFEHSVANMYFIPIALFIKYWGSSDFFNLINKTPGNFPSLTLNNFFTNNLIPVTIGNIIGGVLLVGLFYWYIYLKQKQSTIK